MRKLTLVLTAICLSFCVQAQVVIGTINPADALNQMAEYQAIIKRIESSDDYKYMLVVKKDLTKRIEEQSDKLKQAKTQEEASLAYSTKLGLEAEMNRRVTPLLKQFEERKRQLTQSLEFKVNAAIEEIALEEACSMVLNPTLISDDFRSYIGEDNFIDITALVVERVAEK